ncbi:MAG TPA: metal ABC transporter permease [Haploplasma sp.]|nr:metal ABC transporter permease [Haploplasma sp.]
MGIDILLIAVVTAISSSLIGVFLVIRRMSMMTDAISHTVLLGIVLAFLLVPDLNSPLLIIGAVIMGLVTVFLTESLVKTRLIKEDAATGVVFPLLFSIAIIIISLFINNVHMDVDAVLLGKLELASIDQFIVFGMAIGPKALYTALFMLLINITFIVVFYKELKLISFDSALATTLGFMPFIIHYLLMGLVSLTAVTAFSSVGSILVIALMIGPPITAMQITKDLKQTLLLSAGIATMNSIVGYLLAIALNVTIAGVIATTTLLTFLLVLFFNPKNGVISKIIIRKKQQTDFTLLVLLIHIANHNNTKIESLSNDLMWSKGQVNTLLDIAIKNEYINIVDSNINLTRKGAVYHNKQTTFING